MCHLLFLEKLDDLFELRSDRPFFPAEVQLSLQPSAPFSNVIALLGTILSHSVSL
jgi:hypothetical protein